MSPPISLTDNDDDELSNLFTVVTIGFVALFVVFGIIGYIDAKYIHRNDLYEISAIIVFGLYAMDFISDIFFAAMTFESNKLIFFCSIAFLFLPLSINAIQLKQAVDGWEQDSENGRIVTKWTRSNTKLLCAVTFISGSGFASVKLLNSGIFRMKQFDIGLKNEQMQTFQDKRIWSIVLLENVPQVILQTIFLAQNEDLSSISVVALMFSVFSIIVSVSAYFQQASVSKRRSVLDIDVKSISFEVVSKEVVAKKKALKYVRKKINEEIADTLGIESDDVEQLRAMAVTGGLPLSFRVRMDKTKNSDTEAIEDCIQSKIENGELAKSIQECWKLSEVPLVRNANVMDSSQRQMQLLEKTQDNGGEKGTEMP